MRSRAAILHDVGEPWSVEEFELDAPRTAEVLVEMSAAGLCHTDDHILKGDMSARTRCCGPGGCPPCSQQSVVTKARASCAKLVPV
ncbi:alcohol dehydrogenase domain protein [Mycobacterium ulcerans str. Harvey]|uniref:Alcohol dehydrogenase domain protein n=1 Tax=Mycobacterium ulcerans str. Harvey TaxID=1299332 RepID=A0ABN0QRI7_MYCUL|nr:alcohol dehydrogenase domain protein [Mycobacterium ulcerans str. Harvey]